MYCRLLDRIFERFTCFKCRNFARWDFDIFFCTWVTTFTGSTFTNFKSTKGANHVHVALMLHSRWLYYDIVIVFSMDSNKHRYVGMDQSCFFTGFACLFPLFGITSLREIVDMPYIIYNT